ncbi:hypothetical protein MHYP_G00156810 [Metynnis hypsauchen]
MPPPPLKVHLYAVGLLRAWRCPPCSSLEIVRKRQSCARRQQRGSPAQRRVSKVISSLAVKFFQRSTVTELNGVDRGVPLLPPHPTALSVTGGLSELLLQPKPGVQYRQPQLPSSHMSRSSLPAGLSGSVCMSEPHRDKLSLCILPCRMRMTSAIALNPETVPFVDWIRPMRKG